MATIRNDPHDGLPGIDFLSEYRKRIWYLFGAVSTAVFLPGSIFIFFDGYRLLATSVIGMLIMFGVNTYFTVRSRDTRLPMGIFVVALTFAVGVSLVERGVIGVFWTFPAVLFINFLAFGWLARIYTAVFLICISAVMLFVLDLEISSRAITGLVVTVLITNIFLGMIDQLQQRLVEQAGVDPLTGALNRREMDVSLQDAIERKRRTNTPASLLLFDIDRFKSVNDTFGHAVGDSVLSEFVASIQSRARHLDKLFRLGGEEFMLFLPDTALSGAAILAEELRLLIYRTKFLDARVITISIGITELDHGETIDEWIKRGDDALYRAKGQGRNCTVEGTPVREVVVPLIDGSQEIAQTTGSLRLAG